MRFPGAAAALICGSILLSIMTSFGRSNESLLGSGLLALVVSVGCICYLRREKGSRFEKDFSKGLAFAAGMLAVLFIAFSLR